jgi:hypothetical protein
MQWVTNIDEKDIGDYPAEKGFIIGSPHPLSQTEWDNFHQNDTKPYCKRPPTMEELKSWGLVGVYKKV